MESQIAQAGASFALSAALLVFVALQRPRTVQHVVLVAVLGLFLVWTGGLIAIARASNASASHTAALFVFAAIMLIPPLWFYLCARVSQAQIVFERPVASMAALLVPSLLDVGLLLTDDRHGLLASGRAEAVFREPASAFAGPLFWVHTAWAYACVGGGILICLGAARRAAWPLERRRLRMVALATAVPVVGVAIDLAEILPSSIRLTPGDIGVSALLLVRAIVRNRFLEPSSLPASEVVSHLRDALVLADDSGRVVDANPAAAALFGAPREELRGCGLAELTARLGTPSDVSPAALLGPEPGTRTIWTDDDRVFEVSTAEVTSRTGRCLGRMLLASDRTDQHRHERERERAQRLESLGVLAAGIAHEINNPLAYLRSSLAHLERTSAIAAKAADRIEGVTEREAEDLAELPEVIQELQAGVDRIASVVSATRKLYSDPAAHAEDVSIDAVATTALRMAELDGDRRVKLESHIAGDGMRVRGSEQQLIQAVLNLLINARQAVAEQDGACVRLETRYADGLVEIQVHDSGPGVPTDVRERIFDPFYTTRGPDAGAGIGLAIAHEIAVQHRGMLEVDGSPLGGARFRLRIPASGRGTESAALLI